MAIKFAPLNNDNDHAFISLKRAFGLLSDQYYSQSSQSEMHYHIAQAALENADQKTAALSFKELENQMRDPSLPYDMRAFNCILVNDLMITWGWNDTFRGNYTTATEKTPSLQQATSEIIDTGIQIFTDRKGQYDDVSGKSESQFSDLATSVHSFTALLETTLNIYVSNDLQFVEDKTEEQKEKYKQIHDTAMCMFSNLAARPDLVEHFKHQASALIGTAAHACVQMGKPINNSLIANQ